jgi:hypothetical protein
MFRGRRAGHREMRLAVDAALLRRPARVLGKLEPETLLCVCDPLQKRHGYLELASALRAGGHCRNDADPLQNAESAFHVAQLRTFSFGYAFVRFDGLAALALMKREAGGAENSPAQVTPLCVGRTERYSAIRAVRPD